MERVKKRRRTRPGPVLAFEGIRIGRRNQLLFGLGLLSIILGFITLALGSTSLPAILLVGGYLVLIPWAILAGPPKEPDTQPPAE